jgi:hypothetical protein
MADQFDKLATAFGHFVIAFNELEVALAPVALAASSLKPTIRWLPRRVSGYWKRHTKCLNSFGAGEGIRTLDPNLGKGVLRPLGRLRRRSELARLI